ncbi:MAG: peptidylprolyl isomerase [Alteraurantiacibacter sp. bin_em_oilr2.035]|nr:peptidylprolyl isomerase [Aurantiacibacter atlanticus]MDF1834453.1 peptidylprolyl isomerase [Alteraurantiacibacter sp. bin_em_oilr2.035]
MRTCLALAALSFVIAAPALAQEQPAPVTPGSVIESAAPEEWHSIAAEDLLVMELAPDAAGEPRTIVIQLMPAPLSQPWVENIRTLARAQYWDGSSINRVQDNYVVQWGQPDEGSGGTVKPVPEGLNVVPESAYTVDFAPGLFGGRIYHRDGARDEIVRIEPRPFPHGPRPNSFADPYADAVGFIGGFPAAAAMELTRDADIVSRPTQAWPTHCYGMVGVGRDVSPDTGDGSQLYTVIGHAPRHLDRNIALVGRVIEGMEHLSSLPRGTGPLSFYETEEELVPILSFRIATDLANPPRFEFLDTGSVSFERYIAVRANRHDDFYNIPAGGVDICNVPVPVRRAGD